MDQQYVGIDFHRRRSVIVRMDALGERLSVTRVANEPAAFAAVIADAGPAPEVVIEATYGWYWIVELLQQQGAVVHLANPKALNWGDRRVKNDVVDATDLADMLRLRRLPEAWIAPPALRELRELVRYRAKLVQLRSGLKAQVHAVMAKEGVLPMVSDMFCVKGNAQLDAHGLVAQLCDSGGVAAEPDRRLRRRDRRVGTRHPSAPAPRPRLRGGPGDQRRGPHDRRDLGDRDRRYLPVPVTGASVFVGWAHARSPRHDQR
jgi:predicted CoA-binding protein